MKKSLWLLLPILSVALFACKKTSGRYTGGYGILFYPRQCSYMHIVPGKYEGYIYLGLSNENYNNPNLKTGEFFLSIVTSNADMKSDDGRKPVRGDILWRVQPVDEPCPSIEKSMREDFRQYSETKTSLLTFEYRTTQITGLTISSPDYDLFGVPVGESLNDCFEIARYQPDYIISGSTKKIICGFTNPQRPTSIYGWLTFSPMAQPAMFLKLKSVPENLPVTLTFEVEMTTADGTVLTDRTQPITLLPDA